jgi:hypothetical protein
MRESHFIRELPRLHLAPPFHCGGLAPKYRNPDRARACSPARGSSTADLMGWGFRPAQLIDSFLRLEPLR